MCRHAIDFLKPSPWFGLVFATGLLTACAEQSGNTLPPGVAEKAAQFVRVNVPDEEPPLVLPPTDVVDQRAPAIAFRQVRDEIRDLAKRYPGDGRKDLQTAADKVDQAWRIFANGSPKLRHLSEAARILGEAYRSIGRAKRATPGIADVTRSTEKRLAEIAGDMARRLLARARIAGLDRKRVDWIDRLITQSDFAINEGDGETGFGGYGNALDELANALEFDADAFRDAVVNTFSGNAVGFALAISVGGSLFDGGDAVGLARTSADEGPLAQSITKESQVASVSKTLTAIVTLRVLQDNGLSADTAIGPYLPSNWSPGPGVAALTFRNVMRHETGFPPDFTAAGSMYAAIQALVEAPLGNTNFTYANNNFGLLRILVAGLMGIDPVDFTEFASDVLTTSAFQIKADEIFGPIGVNIGCSSSDQNPTIQYNLPAGNNAGYEEPDRNLVCGGVGWFISAAELTNIMTNLRNTENLLNTESRTVMQTEFLGFLDPLWNWNFMNGDLGVYYMHGGDWNHGPGELHSCVAAFPNVVEASLIINSEHFQPYQCTVLRDAYDNAWSTN